MSGYGGGHRAGTGRRGASEFPAAWSDEEIVARIEDVGRRPDATPRRLPHGPWHTTGVRAGVRIVVLVEPDGAIRAAFPVEGPGVVHRSDRGVDPAQLTVADLADGRVGLAASTLVVELGGRLDQFDAQVARELHEAGEWDELGLLLAAALSAMTLTADQRALLAVLI